MALIPPNSWRAIEPSFFFGFLDAAKKKLWGRAVEYGEARIRSEAMEEAGLLLRM